MSCVYQIYIVEYGPGRNLELYKTKFGWTNLANSASKTKRRSLWTDKEFSLEIYAFLGSLELRS